MRLLLVGCFLFLHGCVGYPESIVPVENFEVERYLGKWYEIARLDHSFERGLSHVSAEYSLLPDGTIQVINRGFDGRRKKWKEAHGKAYFVGDESRGHLKVSFFGPFYSSYVVFDVDQTDYHIAYVTSYSRSFLWLLSRKPEVAPEILEKFIKTAGDLGFSINDILLVDHGKNGLRGGEE